VRSTTFLFTTFRKKAMVTCQFGPPLRHVCHHSWAAAPRSPSPTNRLEPLLGSPRNSPFRALPRSGTGLAGAGTQRRAPHDAVEPARRRNPDFQLRCKSGPRWYPSVSPPLPDREHRRARRNFGRTTAGRPGGPNCESPIISRASPAK
jgi:hypothetical protein